MKNRLTLLIAFIAGCYGAMAQGNFYLQGTVSGPNGPAGGVQVCVMTDSSYQTAFNYYDCTTTDSNGYYAFGIAGGALPGPNIVYTVSATACGTITSNQVQNAQGTVNMVTQNITLSCDPVANACQSSFIYSLSPSGDVYFQQTSGSGYFYDWSFGDGGLASTGDPMHTFSGSPGDSFQVCLTIYNSTGCQSTSCQTIYPIPNSSSGCDASFSTYDSTAHVIYFLPNATGSNFAYFWDFGDGSPTSSSVYPNHYYANGTYNACLHIYNLTDSCTSTSCQTIVVNDSVVNPGCQASFTFSYTTNNTIAFQQTSSTPTNQYFYNWSFGDGSGATTGDPSHTFTVSGSYDTAYVCLTIYDNAGCQNTLCQYILVSDSTIFPPDSCYSYFTFAQAPVNNYEFSFTSQVNGAVQYAWDFGDGSSSSAANPSHVFAANGVYNVCLTTTNSTGCQSIFCANVTVGTVPTTYSIYGVVLANGNNASPATVYLISADSTGLGLALNLVDATTDSNGYFYFGGLSAGNYLVKAALTPNSSDYANFLPTYNGDVLFWNNASYVNPAVNGSMLEIHLVAGNNPGGPGFIGGLVSQGANKTEGPGDPINDAQVMILNMSNEAFAYDMTGTDGAFAFSNLPYGTYKVYTEVLGLPTTPVIVTIEPGNTQIDNVTVVVNSDGVTTGIEKAPTMVEMTGLFPNPAKESVQLNLNSKIDGDLTVQIVNMSGLIINSQVVKANKGQNTIVLPVQSLAAGIYSVKVSTENYSVVKRIVKL